MNPLRSENKFRGAHLVITVMMSIICGVMLSQAQQTSPNVVDAAAKVKKEILKIEDMRNQALLKRDTVTLDHLCADDMAWTSPNGVVLTKAQMLSDIKTGKEAFSSIAHDDVQMHIYENTVVVYGVSRSTVQYKGDLRNKPRRFTNVYVRCAGEWKLVDHQVTPISD
jgi:hypothetical protein